jgi:hypothetical protein
MPLSRTLGAVGASVLLTAALAGCGGSSTLTATEFKSQANKLCAAANKDTTSYGANLTESSTDADAAAFVAKVAKRNAELADAIDKLKEPTSMSADVSSMLASVRDGIKQFKNLTTIQQLMAFNPNSGSFKDANDKSLKLGLKTCAD